MTSGLFFGLLTLDVEYLVDAMPGPDDKVVAAEQMIAAGGPATNAAKTFARLGGRATLGTSVGRAPLGGRLAPLVREHGVELLDLAHEPAEAPISSIIVSRETGARAVVSVNAHASPLPASTVDDVSLDGIAIVMVDGHHMPAAIALAARAHGIGIPVVMDAGSWKTDTDQLLSHVSWAICSQRFAPPGVQPGGHAVLDAMLDAGCIGAAVTRGSDEILWSSSEARGSIPVPETAKVVDTLGAGDVLHGASCLAIARGESFPAALAFGARAAANSCAYFGVDGWLHASGG